MRWTISNHSAQLNKPEPVGPFRWNLGAWLGAQIGGSAWLVGAAVHLRDSPGLAFAAGGCFVGINAFGLWLWSKRQSVSAYAGLQVLLAVMGFVAFAFLLLMRGAGPEGERFPNGESYWWLLLFPGLMLLFWFQQRGFQHFSADWSHAVVAARYDWRGRRVQGGEVVDVPGEGAALHVENRSGRDSILPLLTIESPPITTHCYSVTGRIRYEGVEGKGYLEMWSEFPDGKRFFSRTLVGSGELACITETSDWRAFRLPFHSRPGYLPRRLEVNLVLPGRGHVWISDMRLEEPRGSAAQTSR